MGYDGIRTALENFCVDNLRLIARLAHELLNSDVPLRHPSAAYVIAITAQNIASYLDGAVPEDSAAVIEAHIRPKIEAVIDAADDDAAMLVMAFDDLARAYADAMRS